MPAKRNGSVAKCFDVLGLIGPARPEITARQVVEELGMPPATAHRFLATMVELGVLATYRRGTYAFGPRISELTGLEQVTNPLSNLVEPVIGAASRDLSESVMACQLSRLGPICMAVATPDRAFAINIRVGTILPLHSTAQGKLWLAGLSARERRARLGAYSLVAVTENTIRDREALDAELALIRRRSHAVNRGENESDLGAIAVPVRDRQGRTILSISMFMLLGRMTDALVAEAVPRLREAAEAVQRRLR